MKKLKAYLDRKALERVLRDHPNVIPDLERELKRAAKWEPDLRQALNQVLDMLVPGRSETP